MSTPGHNLRYLRHSVLGLVLWENPPGGPGAYVHSDMARDLLQAFPGSTIISAGYAGISRGEVICHGDSMSLGLKCDNPTDTMKLQRALGLGVQASKPYRSTP